MSKVLAVLTGVAALAVASPSFAQDKSSNTFGPVNNQGAANFEAVYEVEPYAPQLRRQYRVPTSRGLTVITPQRESGASKRG